MRKYRDPEKMNFDILTVLHVSSAHEYDKVGYVCRLSVCMLA
jgi:hypothetical protein